MKILSILIVVTVVGLVTAGSGSKSGSKDKSKSSGEKSGSKSGSKDKSKSSGNKSGSKSGSKDGSKSSGNKSESKSGNKDVSRRGCTKNGKLFAVGLFTDPSSSCNVCKCFENGNYECMRKKCNPANCGLNLRQLADDGCCMKCDRKCSRPGCKRLSCAKRNQLYRENSCCLECGCRYKGKLVPEGVFGDRCDRCRCRNGVVTCSPPSCPRRKLQCCDSTRDNNCNAVCPTGKNCRIGNVIIRYGEYKEVGNKLCTCAGDWFPNAFCAKLSIPRRVKVSQKSNCVAEISDYRNWKKYF